METPRCSEISNLSADWKLNPNVECRIILNKLKIKTPEFETMEFCRTLRNPSVPIEPAHPVSTTDMHFKSEFVLDILLNEILGKCEEKCKVCEEYVQQLRHHIIQAHSGHPNPSPHAQTVTVFKCDVCSSIYSSPSMLIRHRNTHRNQSDTLTTPCTNEPEPVRFYSNNIYPSLHISCVTSKNESVGSVQCEDHPHQPVPSPPLNFEWNCLKQEEFSSSQSDLEISNPNSLGILQHVNHLSTIENDLKQESEDLECQDELRVPLLLQDIDFQVPSFVKYECTETSTESEQQTVLMTLREKSSNDTPRGRESCPVPSDLILIKHKIQYSNVQKPHKCEICGKGFGKSHLLTRHKFIHSAEKPHKCDVCGNCFGQRFVLTRHKLIHAAERPHSCDVCGRSFAQRSTLTRHKLTHTGEKPHKCDTCGRCFAEGTRLRRHKLSHTGEIPFCCEVCGMGFALVTNLTNHKLVHTGERQKPYGCNVCGKCFFSRTGLTSHKLTHTGEKSFQCDVCGKDFALDSILTQHKLIHTREGSFSCDICGKCFSRQDVLRKHKLIHTGERPHKCDVCGMCFGQSAHLTRHKWTHTKETPFHCDVCGHGFNERYKLNQHKLKQPCLSSITTTATFVNHLKEDREESEEEGCQEDPLLNL